MKLTECVIVFSWLSSRPSSISFFFHIVNKQHIFLYSLNERADGCCGGGGEKLTSREITECFCGVRENFNTFSPFSFLSRLDTSVRLQSFSCHVASITTEREDERNFIYRFLFTLIEVP